MLRRVINALLIVCGGVPLVWALRSLPSDARRAAAVAALAAVGIALNVTGLTVSTLNIRPWLRVLACVVAAAAAGGAVLLWHRISYEALPTVPEDEVVLRAKVELAGSGLLWIAAGLIYVGVSIGVLPGRGRASPPASE